MTDHFEEILSTSEKTLSNPMAKKGQDEYIQRTVIKNRDGAKIKLITDIHKQKITKKLAPAVIERMKWKKFGIVKDQVRGSLEPGIVVVSNEIIHIIDRQKDLEQDMADKLKDSINDRKKMVLKEMKEQNEKENRDKLAAYNQSNANKSKIIRKNRETCLKIVGFKPTYRADDLQKIFEKIGKVKRCHIPNRTIGFLTYEQSIHVYEAYEEFNDQTVDGCVLRLQILDNKD